MDSEDTAHVIDYSGVNVFNVKDHLYGLSLMVLIGALSLSTFISGCHEDTPTSENMNSGDEAANSLSNMENLSGSDQTTLDMSISGGGSAGDIEESGGDMTEREESLGRVSFIPVYEQGSAWESNAAARQMVTEVFGQFESILSTSGEWDTTIEVYLTDDHPGFASTAFDETFFEADVNGQRVLVVSAWQQIVSNTPDSNGPAQPNGEGAEFIIHFNVEEQADNSGLLRHEMMHGLGAVNALPNFTAPLDGPFAGPMPGERVQASLYDLSLIDLNRQPLLGDYDINDHTFEVQPYMIETSLMEWMDGDGGIFFRGTGDDGNPLDMACGTFPIGDNEGAIILNEPLDVMSAGVHPSWHQIAEPDRAFLRAMGYQIITSP